MPAFSTIPAAELLPAAVRLFSGLRDNDEIAADLAPFHYGKADATVGLALVDALRDAMSDQGTEEAEKITASKASALATAAVRAALVSDRRRARRAHPAGTAGYSALNLNGEAPEAEAALLAEARHVYETLQSSPDLAAPIRGLSAKGVTDALALVAAAETADDDQTRETGESERASALRGLAEDTLRRTCSALAADATDALAPKPQLREVLGLHEPGN